MDQGVIFSLMPKVDVRGNVLLDLLCLDSPVLAAEDAGHEDQRALGAPLAFVYSTELGSH
jgi:hypothetical protein